ncbi:Na+:H+ dicarboxylate symporter [Bifidobacterium callitrichos]|uniref:Na+:H+ dicarboxylate symporter n=1 Tax=Bifidobacterium callitrichos TaxID=762209 RepID=UPI0011B27847|nr:Na+:H+ dicarboxylate symporter [Bifidobacterium callitrichos]
MAAATFICTMTYQSDGQLMREVRLNYGECLSKNWQSIILWSLLDAVLPLITIALWETNKNAGFSLSIFALVNLIAKSTRSVYWLNYTLFMQNKSDHIIQPYTESDFRKDSITASHN